MQLGGDWPCAMAAFATQELGAAPDARAPDGAERRVLCAVRDGSMAHFRLPPGGCSRAVVHRTVEELWFVVTGEGAVRRSQDGVEEIVALRPGVSLSILPWPGDDEAVAVTRAWWACTCTR